MRAYVRGLLGEAERKNGWTLAEAAGDAGPERMQRLLNFYAWDCDGVRDDLRAVLMEALGADPDGVLIVGEAEFLKKGNKSAGVARHYSRVTRRGENAQIGVLLAYESRRGAALIDRELFLPKGWIVDRERRRLAGIGDEVVFATRPVLARRMIDRVLQARVPFGWVTDAQEWGRDSGLRMWLEARHIAYVLTLPSGEWGVPAQVSRWPPAHRTQRYEWAVVDVRKSRRQGWARSLLTRRSISEPAEMADYVCFAPVETTVAELARVAGGQRSIEECLRMARGETGLDQYQARGYQAWYRHVTLAMVAAAFLAITHARQRPPPRVTAMPVRQLPAVPSRKVSAACAALTLSNMEFLLSRPCL